MNFSGENATDLYKSLERIFRPQECTDIFPRIGIQHHNTDLVKKIYTSTFASEKVINEVLSRNEKDIMIFTHHPVPPKANENLAYPDIPDNLIHRMKENRINLFSYHIPLDRHSIYSPSYTLSITLGLKPYDTFYLQNGVYMGELCYGDYGNVADLCTSLEKVLGHDVKLYTYGDKGIKNKRIAVMAGCAKQDIYEFLKKQGINTFVTGVTNKEVFWVPKIHELAECNEINIIGGTHYSTEKFALISISNCFIKLGIPCEFIEEKPNMSDI
jgi:putative NIF3 family GTP cyclohydrolase 1 type 2